MTKPKIAIFDFGCCEGCQLQIVNLEEELLDLVGLVDVVSWREAMTGHSDQYDIAIVEGPITRQGEMERLKGIREKAKVLVALLAAGKMEQLRSEKKEVVLNETIGRVVELMQAKAEEKGLEMRVEIAGEPLIVVRIEEGLERVFMNLVSNAVKYTPADGSVTVKAWSEDNQIKVAVSDTGIGIPKEALLRIFGEFYRAKNAKAMEMEGTGLGLTIAKDVVERHGGQISVESIEGQGSTFCVTLPRS